MSLILNNGTKPKDLYTKSYPSSRGGKVIIGEYTLSMTDFIGLAEYVLTNTDLGRGDPRRKFVEWVKKLVQTEGYNPGGKRLELANIADIVEAKVGTRQPRRNSRKK